MFVYVSVCSDMTSLLWHFYPYRVGVLHKIGDREIWERLESVWEKESREKE